MTAAHYRQILGVRFFAGSASAAVLAGMRGGLVAVPAAPLLIDLPHDAATRAALLNADLVITDSGFMVLLWWLFRHERLPRVSGLEYLRLMLRAPEVKEPGSMFWVMPSAAARDRAVTWLRAQGLPCTDEDFYLAPMYAAGAIDDPELVRRLSERRPRHIVLALGGGTQERLGLSLKNDLDYRPGIHCIGAAIGFLTGDQVVIPAWADHLYLGWLMRCVSAPRRFVPRYWRARKLASLLWRHGDRLPDPA
jgi:N-acetylglucosaminyldiphosphoundecaprenol N-acetyl-beta-D-mannosaminyltransferase